MRYFLFLMTNLNEFVRISYAYRTPILLTSAVMAFAFAAILLSSNEARQLAGRWVQYVGWAFLAFGFQYIFRLLGWLMRDSPGDIFILFRMACNFFGNLGSGASNLFFLAAALVLLNRRTPFLRVRIFLALITTTAVLTMAANFYFVDIDSPWLRSLARLPDALFSAVCLGLFGYATMRNLLTHRRLFWATMGILIAFIYGSVQLAYAANPVWAKTQQAVIENALIRAPYSSKPIDPVEYLDSAIFAVGLPLRMLFFVPPFYLFLTLVIAAHDFRKVLRVVTEQKKSYLSSDGIVQAIGESVSATLVEVFIKLPGSSLQAAWRISWPHSRSSFDHQFLPLSPTNSTDQLLLKVLRGKSEIRLDDSGEEKQLMHNSVPREITAPLVMLPVRFHGAVIGCLKAEFSKARNFNYAALQQLNGMADLLGPALQDYRLLASLDQLSDRLARLQIQKPGAEFNETILEMGRVLHDVLSPLGTGLLMEAGFRANHVLEGQGEFLHVLNGQAVCYDTEDLATEVVQADIGDVKVYRNQLIATDRHDPNERYPLGNLILILPSEFDSIDRPTLGDDSLHRRAVASQTADAFLDLVRTHLRYELNLLSVNLNAEALTQEAWLTSIHSMGHKVGLSWVGVSQQGSTRVWGDPCAEQIIQRLNEEDQKVLNATELSCVVNYDEVTKTHHVMRIELKKSARQVWFGIARKGFGLELLFPSPWMEFLEDFTQIADSALASLFEVQKSKEALAKLAEDRGVMNIAITTGHLMHELANKVDAQQLPAESLCRAIDRGDIQVDANQKAQMFAILNAATVMKDLISIFKNVTKTDDRGIFPLRDVVMRVVDFYAQIIIRRNIKIRNRVKDDLWINMPFNVALFAIANLVGNAKEAIEERISEMEPEYLGEIRIEANSDGDYVVCDVIDNGPGISEGVIGKLYQLGSTKPGHNGWGLYLTNRSLVEYGGEIKLLESSPGLTRFSLRFPKAETP